MSEWIPLELPADTIEVETPDICVVCHQPASKRYQVDRISVKLCDKHKPAEGQPKPKPRRAKGDAGQLSLF